MATSDVLIKSVNVSNNQAERTPRLTSGNILAMNVGLLGGNFSSGLAVTAINPVLSLIGARPDQLPLLNLAGPMTGLIIQPLIGAISDRNWSPRWGRRRPVILAGMALCVVILFAFPFVSALWMAVICLWLLDGANNSMAEPYGALVGDMLPKNQLARGFLTQAMFGGLGAVLANVSLFVFQKVISGASAAGFPYWVFASFWLGAVCCLVAVLFSMSRLREIPPTPDELAEMNAKRKGLVGAVTEITSAVRAMPVGMHKLGVAYLFQWYAMFIYWQFISISIGESVFKVHPGQPGYSAAAGWTGIMNGFYNLVAMGAALLLMPLCQRWGGRKVHSACLLLAAGGLVWVSMTTNQYLLIIPMIGIGFFQASMGGVPRLLVVSMVPKSRLGVYMGIQNMMVVVPMLIETVTFGWIFEHLLGGKGTNAILLAGVLMGLASVAMLWVSPPKAEDESSLMPIGPRREISVYDRVVVGTDGSPSALYAVDRAHEVAAAAEARVVVVSAYNPDIAGRRQPAQPGERQEIYGEDAALAALETTVKHLTSERIREIDQVLVPGKPAEALLGVAGHNPANLIVVGNRGLGADKGQLLGAVPATIVKNASCDVLIIQTSALTEEEDSISATLVKRGRSS